MSKLSVPFRFDYVGSFLRPQALLDARSAYEKKELCYEELKKVEDEAITKLVKEQKNAGYHVITDGEFRRHSWHLDFMWGLNGIKRIELNHGYYFNGIETYHTSVEIEGKISGENHPFVEHFKFVKQFEDENTIAKQTIPAPAQTLSELLRADNVAKTNAVYPDLNDLIEDLAKAYRTVIKELSDAGCKNIQFDDCTWGLIVDKNYWEKKVGKGVSVDAQANTFLKVNNLAIEGKPDGVTITTHVCRGNYQSAYAATGPYDRIAPFLFDKENVDAFYLEYDDARSGGFEPLKYVSPDKKVVLGLITSKRPELEDKEKIKKRILEASQYVPLDRLYLSPQCGFSSNAIGNKLTFEDQWKKLALVKEIAQEIWKD
ncbi:MAG: 5-methyltetrahydropteroyltriglutamate--homocysteine S-methyltransferase [Aeromonadales bacterium]|nr:5-methyltetrahydropteroyltriglutamate--homocysteine S-methyltransferase [Aeromonadales bacterium]